MFVRVAVPVPGLDVLTYRVPSGLVSPVVGARVVVPLGSRWVTGVVAETDAQAPDTDAIKAIREVLDGHAFVPQAVVELAQWTATYYGAGAGETITAVLPPLTRHGRASAHKTVRVASITAAGLAALAAEQVPGLQLSSKQRDLLALLAGAPLGISTPQLAGQGIPSDTVVRLAARGLIGL